MLIAWAMAGCARGISVSARGSVLAADDGYPLIAYEVVETTRSHAGRPAAAVFYVQGSQNESVLRAIDRLASFAAMGMPVYLLERRGVSDKGLFDAAAAAEHCTRERRVLDCLTLLEHSAPKFDERAPVLLIGSSEGGDVAAEVAARSRRVTHLMLLGCGGGMSQAEELRLMVRRRPGYLGIADEAALDARLADMRARPDAGEEWLGHPYRRWASFLWSPPVDAVRRLRIPVFLAHGALDQSVPVESARRLAEGAAGVDITYVEYPGVDHRFTEVATGRSVFPRLEVDGVRWLAAEGVLTPGQARAFEDRVRRNHPDLTTAPR